MSKKKNPNLTKREALKLAWEKRKDYKGYDKSKGSRFNTWRGIIYTKKGKKIGFPKEWGEYDIFLKDTPQGWEKGKILVRKDTTIPYSKENILWENKGMENLNQLITLTYNNETKTLLEWCQQLNLNYNGVRTRYFRNKRNYTPKEILYGITIVRGGKKIVDINELEKQERRDKISKMLSAYKCKDKKRGLSFNLTREFMERKIFEPCVYCGDTKRIGLDRIDNSKGHTEDNCVSCCYECNVARSDIFSYEEMFVLGKTIKQIKYLRGKNENK